MMFPITMIRSFGLVISTKRTENCFTEMSPFSIWTFPPAYGTCNLKQMTTFVNLFVGKYSKFPKAMHTSFPTYQTPMSERFLEATALQNLLLEKRVVDLLDSIRNG